MINSDTQYIGTTAGIASIGKGGLYLMYLQDVTAATAGSAINTQTQVRFTDE